MRTRQDSALRDTLRAGYAMRRSRLESFCVLVIGGFVARTGEPVSHLARYFPGRAQTASNDRRLQRFFEQVTFGFDALAKVLVAVMGRKRTSGG